MGFNQAFNDYAGVQHQADLKIHVGIWKAYGLLCGVFKKLNIITNTKKHKNSCCRDPLFAEDLDFIF